MSYVEHTKYRGLDGVVIACVDFYDPEVIELIQSDVPVVTIDHLFNNRVAIMSDNVRGMQDLVNYVCSQGHKKIAYIYGDDSAVSKSRLTSFYNTLEANNIEIPQDYVKRAGYRNLQLSAKRTAELLELKEPPTCILYPDDYAAMGGMNYIKEKRLRIPEDVSIAGYDGIAFISELQPPLTTLGQNTRRIGKLAATKLISLIEKPQSTVVEQIVVEGKLIAGESVSKV